jgi:acetyltransferase
MYRYYQYRQKEVQPIRTFDVDRSTVRSIIESSPDGYLPMEDVIRVLTAYGLRFPDYGIAHSPDEAVELASRTSYPVVLKALAEGVVHKTDLGAVKLDLRTEYEVKGAYYEIMEALKRAGVSEKDVHGIAVQKMLHGGKETIIGVTTDPVFGPLIMFGMGGIYVEVLRDVVFRIPPVSEADAREMIEAIRGYPILRGVRGERPADMASLIEAIQRVSQLIMENPEIHEMDLNPVMVMPEGGGIFVLDARIRIARNAAAD